MCHPVHLLPLHPLPERRQCSAWNWVMFFKSPICLLRMRQSSGKQIQFCFFALGVAGRYGDSFWCVSRSKDQGLCRRQNIQQPSWRGRRGNEHSKKSTRIFKEIHGSNKAEVLPEQRRLKYYAQADVWWNLQPCFGGEQGLGLTCGAECSGDDARVINWSGKRKGRQNRQSKYSKRIGA